jgi:hypothetical protein
MIVKEFSGDAGAPWKTKAAEVVGDVGEKTGSVLYD